MICRNNKQFSTFAGNQAGKEPNYAKSYIDPKKQLDPVTEMYWKMDGTQSFNDFISLAITEMKRQRSYGYVQLFLYPTKKEFVKNQNKYIAIFIRKWNIYVVGVQSVKGNVYQIRRADDNERCLPIRYIYSPPTGFGREYGELFQGTGLNGDLVGAWIGFHVLNQAILRVIKQKNPRDWAWSIGVFALTFSECIRFVWSLRKLSDLIDNKEDIRMEFGDKYLAKIPKMWSTISDCARVNRGPNDPTRPQPEYQKYSMAGLADLELVVQYAIDALNIQLWNYYGYNESVEAQQEEGPGFGDGGRENAY